MYLDILILSRLRALSIPSTCVPRNLSRSEARILARSTLRHLRAAAAVRGRGNRRLFSINFILAHFIFDEQNTERLKNMPSRTLRAMAFKVQVALLRDAKCIVFSAPRRRFVERERVARERQRTCLAMSRLTSHFIRMSTSSPPVREEDMREIEHNLAGLRRKLSILVRMLRVSRAACSPRAVLPMPPSTAVSNSISAAEQEPPCETAPHEPWHATSANWRRGNT
jgi:hypothetical protein